MQLFQAWAESITFFKSENLKPFLLITLKALKDTYAVMIAKFWYVFIGALVLDVTAYALLMSEQGAIISDASTMNPLFWGIIFLIAMIGITTISFITFLCVRPSIAPKGWFDVMRCRYHFIYFFCVWPFALIAKNSVLLFFVYCIFCILFFLDYRAGMYALLSSCKRAFWMLLYNAPCIVISSLFFSVLLYAIGLIVDNFSSTFSIETFILRFCLVNIIELPVLICFYSNFYIKKKYEQFNLYFDEKGR